jgi:DNA replication protein DnaC
MNVETLEKMRQLRLWGMYQTFKTSMESDKASSLTADELISVLVNSEWDDRQNRNIERAIRNARFRYSATIEQLDYNQQRGLDKNLVHRLAEGEFIRKREDLFITGSTGTGKSYLASAIGYQACQLGFKVLYANTTKLMASLKMAKADGSVVKELLKNRKAGRTHTRRLRHTAARCPGQGFAA